MIEQGILHIQSIIELYGAWGVFIATMIEEIIAPIPSSLVPLAAGFFLLPADATFALVGVETALLIALPVAIGVGLASTVIYWLAYYGGKPAIERTRKLTGVAWEDVERIERTMTKGKRDEVTLFALRLLPVIPGFALSAFCGAVRYRFSTFLIITLLGSGLRAFALSLAGWQAGELYIEYFEIVERFEKQIFLGLLGAAVVLCVLYFFWKKKRKSVR